MATRDSQRQMALAQAKRDLEDGLEAIASSKLINRIWKALPYGDEQCESSRDHKVNTRWIQGPL